MKRLVVEDTIEERYVFYAEQKNSFAEGSHSMLKLQDVKMGEFDVFVCPTIFDNLTPR